MADEYALVSRGKLKLKTDSEIKKKKSKKHNKKEKEKLERGMSWWSARNLCLNFDLLNSISCKFQVPKRNWNQLKLPLKNANRKRDT